MSQIYLTFSHHLLLLIKCITALGAVALTIHCFVDQILTPADLLDPSAKTTSIKLVNHSPLDALTRFMIYSSAVDL